MICELKAGHREYLGLYWTAKEHTQFPEVLYVLIWEKAPFFFFLVKREVTLASADSSCALFPAN